MSATITRTRLVRALVALVLATPVVVLPAAATVHAEPGKVEVDSEFTYVIDPAQHMVHVSVEFTFTNMDWALYYSTFQLYRGTWFAAPAGATRFTNVDIYTNPAGQVYIGPEAIVTERDPFTDDYINVYVEFSGTLFPERKARHRVTYDLEPGELQSAAKSRMNDGYFGFVAMAAGDPKRSTVHIVAPDDFEFVDMGDEWVASEQGGTTTYTSATIPEPNSFRPFVEFRDTNKLTSTKVSTSTAHDFSLTSWPDDTAWPDLVGGEVKRGVPKLEDLIGQPWPYASEVAIDESVAAATLDDTDGIDPSTGAMQFSDSVDPALVIHRLSHAWFNDKWFAGRWLQEGFAQLYSNMAAGSAGRPAPPMPTNDPAKIALNDWGDPDLDLGVAVVAQEQYATDASYTVVQYLLDDIGQDRMRAVLAAVADGSPAYPGPGSPAAVDRATDWRRFLDLVENIGGAPHASSQFERYVLGAGQRAEMNDRSDARDAYAELVADGGEWAAPLVVRTAMSDWKFDDATDAMSTAGEVLTVRDELAEQLALIGESVPESVRAAYESAATVAALSDVTTSLHSVLATATVLARADAADHGSHGVFGSIGLIGDDLDGTMKAARAAFAKGDYDTAERKADEVIDAADGAAGAGLLRVGIALALVLSAGGVVVVRRRRPRPAAEGTVAEPVKQEGEPAS